jgi:hypothetical protein
VNLVLALDVVVGVVVLALLALGALAVRRRLITRRGGTFDCSLRLDAREHGKGWVLGVGRYAGDTLEWYRVFSYALRPRRSFARRELQVVESRDPSGVEVFALLSGVVVVRCLDAGRAIELAMSPQALTGFLSWVESAPPGVPRG